MVLSLSDWSWAEGEKDKTQKTHYMSLLPHSIIQGSIPIMTSGTAGTPLPCLTTLYNSPS